MPFPAQTDNKITLLAAAGECPAIPPECGAGAEQGAMTPGEVFDEWLQPAGCAGIRFYYGESDKGEHELTAFSVDSGGNDMTSAQVFDYSLLALQTAAAAASRR